MPRDVVVPAPDKILSVKEVLGKAYTEKLAYSYPEAMPPYYPVGEKIIVQLRTPGNFKVLANGQKFYLADETVDYEKYNIQTALVRAVGPLAYCDRRDKTPWIEGPWCKVGDFVRVPKFGGDRVGVPLGDEQKRDAMFLAIIDRDVIGVITGDPLGVKTIA